MVEKDVQQAQHWLEGAAKQNLAVAQFQLGHFYRKGENGSPNGAEAIKWYEQAADLGFSPAMVSLGIMNDLAEAGVPRDVDRAIQWYRQAAENGEGQACNLLSGKYLAGDGVQLDRAQAYAWALLSVWAGERNGDAQTHLYAQHRDTMLRALKPVEIAAGEKLAQRWVSQHWEE